MACLHNRCKGQGLMSEFDPLVFIHSTASADALCTETSQVVVECQK